MRIIPDHLVLYLQLEVLGIFISAIAYGIVSILSGNCIYLLQKKRGTQSYPIRILLLIYVTVIGLMYFPIALILTIWGENGFMVRISIPHQEQRFTVLQIWRCVVLYQDTSNRPRILITVPLSLLSLVSLGRSVSISTPPIQISHENIRMRCHGISQRGYGLLDSVHTTLLSRQYHARNINRFPTHLPSETLPKCPWSRTRTSLYQHYDHVC